MFSHPVTEEEIVSEKNTIVNQVTELAKQTWSKVSPFLQRLLLKSTQGLIPALQGLNQKLVKEVTPESSDNIGMESGGARKVPTTQNPNLAKAIALLKPIASKTLQFLIKTLESLQRKLESSPAISAPQGFTGTPRPALKPGDPLPLADQVQQEVGVAWKFVQTQLVPVVLTFTTKAVEKIDPPVSSAWQKFTANPTVASTWAKVEANDLWKKSSTAIAPVGRSMQSILGQIQLSDGVKHILEKRAAVTALVLVVTLFFLVKPLHVLSFNAKAPTPAPTQIAKQVKQPIQKPVADLTTPEKTGKPVAVKKVVVNDTKTQISDVSKKYGEALVQSVETNPKVGRLIVSLGDAWYQLDAPKQSQLMSDLLARSQSLKFPKLVVADSEMHLIARSPVAGNEMVIVRR
jgi:hypothetical protein